MIRADEKPSGLQVSAFRVVEPVADTLPDAPEHEKLAAAAEMVKLAMSDVQAAELDRRLPAYVHRREQAEEAWARRQIREGVAAEQNGVGNFNCRSCGAFRRRPTDECPKCGDQEGTHNGNDTDTNRYFGYAA